MTVKMGDVLLRPSIISTIHRGLSALTINMAREMLVIQNIIKSSMTIPWLLTMPRKRYTDITHTDITHTDTTHTDTTHTDTTHPVHNHHGDITHMLIVVARGPCGAPSGVTEFYCYTQGNNRTQ